MGSNSTWGPTILFAIALVIAEIPCQAAQGDLDPSYRREMKEIVGRSPFKPPIRFRLQRNVLNRNLQTTQQFFLGGVVSPRNFELYEFKDAESLRKGADNNDFFKTSLQDRIPSVIKNSDYEAYLVGNVEQGVGFSQLFIYQDGGNESPLPEIACLFGDPFLNVSYEEICASSKFHFVGFREQTEQGASCLVFSLESSDAKDGDSTDRLWSVDYAFEKNSGCCVRQVHRLNSTELSDVQVLYKSFAGGLDNWPIVKSIIRRGPSFNYNTVVMELDKASGFNDASTRLSRFGLPEPGLVKQGTRWPRTLLVVLALVAAVFTIRRLIVFRNTKM